MWWKLLLLTLYFVLLFILSRILEVFVYYESGYLATRLLDPVALSVRKLKTLLDQRGVSYTGVVEKHELTDLVDASGESSEGELELAMAEEEEASATNFTCGSHFYEEVEDTKDSVWLVQVVPDRAKMVLPQRDWHELIKILSRFGIRTGIFDCSLDWRLCARKQWYSPRLVLALPHEHLQKGNVNLQSYTDTIKTPAVVDWVNRNLASRVKEIYNFQQLRREWFMYNDIKTDFKIRVLLLSPMSTLPLFYTALSVKFPGRVKFGTVNTHTKEGKNILNRLRLKKTPTYIVITPEKNFTFGSVGGQYLNFRSMQLLLKSFHPEVNDIFLLSLIIVNVACWFELFIMAGGPMQRGVKLLWMLGKWNCVLLLLWLPGMGLFQWTYLEGFVNSSLKVLRYLSGSPVAELARKDWQHYGDNSNILLLTFLLYATIVGVLSHCFRHESTEADVSSSFWSDWRSNSWNSYMNYLFRPVTSLTRPVPPPDHDLEYGMELLIERLAIPHFWLHPIIAPEYVNDLPVWRFTQPDRKQECLECYTAEQLNQRKPPDLFICEKCRALQNPKRMCTALEIAESESACAKFVMDGDYKCQCQFEGDGWHSDDEVIRKPNRGRHRTLSSDNIVYSCGPSPDDPQDAKKENPTRTSFACNHGDSEYDSSDTTTEAPPGVLMCNECVICLEFYCHGDLLCGLPCGHSFHQQCIMEWLSRDNHCCPSCRWPTYKAKPCSLHLHSE